MSAQLHISGGGLSEVAAAAAAVRRQTEARAQ